MKRIPSLFLLGSILVVIFCACHKDAAVSNNSNNPNNNNTVSDSNYTDRLYIIDSTAAGEDTVQVEIYNYDNLKRVTTIIDTLLNPQRFFALKKFEYAGTDSLPFKSTLYVHDGTAADDTVIIYHYFDATGRLIKDSTINISRSVTYQVNSEITDISYGPGKMYGYSRHKIISVNGIPSASPTWIMTDTVTLDANGNMAEMISYDGSSRFTVTRTFDNHSHPFRRLNIFMCWGHEIFRTRYLDPSEPNTNNITHVSESATGSQNYTRDYDILNTYYPNGLLKTIAHPEIAGSAEYMKYFFTYKSL